jgi:hypothetical protein
VQKIVLQEENQAVGWQPGMPMQEVGRQVQVGQVTQMEVFPSHQELEECGMDLTELASPSSSLNLTVGSPGVGRDQEFGQIGLV